MTDYMLPTWLNELLPEPKPYHTVSCVGTEKLLVTSPKGKVKKFTDLKGMGEYIHDKDAFIEQEVYELWGKGDSLFGLSYPTRKNYHAMILASTDRDRIATLERHYEYALRNHIRYQANPSDFFASYDFVDSHPAFWTCRSFATHPYYWETEGHGQHVFVCVMKDDNGRPVIALETGAHIPGEDPYSKQPGYTNHYHDYRLDTYAPTWEESFIQLAALVDKFFYPDGTEKEDVAHEKPEWIITLEERIKEIEDSSEDD